MDKEKIITRITDCGIVAVVRADSADQAKRITDACIEGGVAAIEMTFTVPHADKVIAELSEMYTEDQIILGAGTVLDSETARIAILAGAQYIVSPYFDLETAKLCNRYRIPYMAGCMTITEVIRAMEAGVDIVDTAISPMALGTSQPPTEAIVATLAGTEYDTGLDLNELDKVCKHFTPLRENI